MSNEREPSLTVTNYGTDAEVALLSAQLAALQADRNRWQREAEIADGKCNEARKQVDDLTARLAVMSEALTDALFCMELQQRTIDPEWGGTASHGSGIAQARDALATLPERAKALLAVVEALEEYKHAMEGFAEAVRAESGHAYPWPAQDIALEKVASALAAYRGGKP